MTTFDDREAAFENKFAHDETLKFTASARACNRVALWVAQRLGMTGQEAEKYAKSMVSEDLQEPGHDDFLNRLRADLQGRVPDAELHHRLDVEITTAMAEVQADPTINPA